MRDAASSADFDPEYLIDTLLNDQVATFDPEFKMQGTIGINMPDSLNAMMDRFRKELKQSDSTKKFTFPIQRNYYTEYSINQIVTQLDFLISIRCISLFLSQILLITQIPGLVLLLKLG